MLAARSDDSRPKSARLARRSPTRSAISREYSATAVSFDVLEHDVALRRHAHAAAVQQRVPGVGQDVDVKRAVWRASSWPRSSPTAAA